MLCTEIEQYSFDYLSRLFVLLLNDDTIFQGLVFQPNTATVIYYGSCSFLLISFIFQNFTFIIYVTTRPTSDSTSRISSPALGNSLHPTISTGVDGGAS